MNPADVMAYIKGLIAKADKALAIALTYAYHLAIAWMISWGLRHGFHLSTGYLGISFLTFFGRFGLTELAHAVGQGNTKGSLAVYIEHAIQQAAASQTVDEHFHDAAAVVSPSEKAADKPSNAYL